MRKSIILSLVVSLALIGGTTYFVLKSPTSSGGAEQSKNVEVREGVQYVTITARGGYSPRVSDIKAGMPTKLVVKTNGTFDCSAALVVRSVGFQKILQSTGEEVIDLGVPKAGEKIQGVCSMGMYSFQLKAS